MQQLSGNFDPLTVEGFGDEWSRFDQTGLQIREREILFEQYFGIFPWDSLPPNAVGFDCGCGTGRWATIVADRVARLHCVDASAKALEVARRNLESKTNCVFHHASVANMPFAEASMDFGYSLGVLHHIPDPMSGLRACVSKLKPGAPFLVYLYYAFDNRPAWFKWIWRLSDLVRKAVSRAPKRLRNWIAEALAVSIYLPFASIARWTERAGGRVTNFPLAGYRDKSFYTIRTDARDRFGTRLEKRFTAHDIRLMMEDAGLRDVTFQDAPPFWCAVGRRI